MKLKGGTSGRKGHLSVATEVRLICSLIYFNPFPRVLGKISVEQRLSKLVLSSFLSRRFLRWPLHSIWLKSESLVEIL